MNFENVIFIISLFVVFVDGVNDDCEWEYICCFVEILGSDVFELLCFY